MNDSRFDWLELDVEPSREGKGHDQPAPRRMPTDGPSFYRAAREMREAGHFKAAADFYRKAIGFDDYHYGARAELIDTLVRANRIQEAARQADDAIESYGQVRLFYASKALVLAHGRRIGDALSHSDVSIEGDENSFYAYAVRAEVLLRQSTQNRQQSVDLIEKSADLTSIPWEPFFLGGWMFLDAGLPALAAGLLAEACRYNPRAAISWLCLGDAFRDLRLYDQALFYYQRVTELESTNELALERQRKCGPLIYGLMRVFRKTDLRNRWAKELEKLP